MADISIWRLIKPGARGVSQAVQVTDIRAYKTSLRHKYKTIRREMAPTVKDQHDAAIRRRLQGLYQYKNAGTLLTFVSLPIEVDTKQLITEALEQGKRVAVPRCIDGTCEMEFYIIRTLEELTPRTFHVLEPDPQRCERLTDFSESLAVVPGLSFDQLGYRLGYGKGYYDRFLSRYDGPKVGVVYTTCMTQRLVHGRYDVAVDLIVTEKYLHKVGPPRYRGARR